MSRQALADALGTTYDWVRNRETGRVDLLVEDVETYIEGCGRELDLAFVRPGDRPVRTGHDPAVVELAEDLMSAWDGMDPAERRLLGDLIRLRARTAR